MNDRMEEKWHQGIHNQSELNKPKPSSTRVNQRSILTPFSPWIRSRMEGGKDSRHFFLGEGFMRFSLERTNVW